jgi:hypothetical protein
MGRTARKVVIRVLADVIVFIGNRGSCHQARAKSLTARKVRERMGLKKNQGIGVN